MYGAHLRFKFIFIWLEGFVGRKKNLNFGFNEEKFIYFLINGNATIHTAYTCLYMNIYVIILRSLGSICKMSVNDFVSTIKRGVQIFRYLKEKGGIRSSTYKYFTNNLMNVLYEVFLHNKKCCTARVVGKVANRYYKLN